MGSGVGDIQLSEGLLQAFVSRTLGQIATHLCDLPAVILSSILARISDPVDVASVICSCKLFRALSKSVPYHIRVWSPKLDMGFGSGCGEDSGHNRFNIPAVGTWTRKALGAVRSQLSVTRVLDLSGCWIVDEDVAAVLADLRSLECLILDDCQKLTSAVADALAVSVRLGPQALSVQRCFGLGPAAAGNLLAAAAAGGSRLWCILFSHLDRLDLPRDPPLMDLQDDKNAETTNLKTYLTRFCSNGSVGAGIRILALHNCSNIGMPELAAVGRTCPMLEFLMLGGSVEGLGLCRPDYLTHEKVAAAVETITKIVDTLKHLLVLEITFFTALVADGVRECLRQGIEVWNFCDRKSVSAAVAFLAGCKFSGYRNTHKLAYESTCDYVNDEGDSSNILDQISSVNVRIPEFNLLNRSENLSSMLSMKTSSSSYSFKSARENFENVLLAVRAASNCTDMRRRTPLHVAAACGDTDMVRGLLEIGAKASGMKDSGGATALFVAAECGYAGACELLLKSGAEVLSRNRAGENSLYIAALRGHPAAVEVIIAHCDSNRINWQSASIYGDGWTPLMAAAVADRQDVATVLLQAAGAEKASKRRECWDVDGMIGGSNGRNNCGTEDNVVGCQQRGKQRYLKSGIGESLHSAAVSGTCTDREFQSKIKTPQILDAQNRYGQTALHIAARRASVWFVSNLLLAGASLSISDGYGKCAVDIAHYQNHTLVTNILRQWEQSLSGDESTPAALLMRSKFSSGNLESGNQCSYQGTATSAVRGRTKVNKWGVSDVSVHQNATGCDTSVDSVVTTVPYLSATSGSTRRVWRARGDRRKVHPDTNDTVPGQ